MTGVFRHTYMINKDIEFQQHRSLLIALTYRMTGSFAEAEEIVQDTAIEWLKCDPGKVQNPKAWLMKVCTNKAIDSLKKAYKKREVYTGTWLPEVLPDSLISWGNEIEHKESLHTSFLILLENLKPKERAVFILKEVFEYSFKEIADFTQLTDIYCRKIYQRANDKIKNQKTTFDPKDEGSLVVLKRLFKFACAGSEEGIRDLLSPDSEFWSDGGGKVSAVRTVFYDPQRIARFFANIFKTLSNKNVVYTYEYVFINGLPGLVLSKQSEKGLWDLETLFCFEFSNKKIARIYAQRNPDKLKVMLRRLNHGKLPGSIKPPGP